MPGKIPRTQRTSTQDRFWWENLPDSELLGVRMCELGVSIDGTWLEKQIQALYRELESKRIRFRPHFWLSNEWFSPTDIPGIAIPFYLAHPRLIRLEKSMMIEAEGSTSKSCMKILRHEAGHAVQVAFQLHRLRRWQNVFGRSSQAYPETYQPKPYSRRYVLHIDSNYAQAHPDEDFAETFAVWLTPASQWKKRYAGWPAIRKLELVDELMREVADRRPVVRSRRHADPISTLRTTLGEHYEDRQEKYGTEHADFYLRDLRRLFQECSADGPQTERAAKFLRRVRPEMLRLVSRWTGEYQYTIGQLYRDMIAKCQELDLCVPEGMDDDQLKLQLSTMLTVQSMNFLHMDGHRISL